MHFDTDPFLLDCRGRILDCRPGRREGVPVMGILNVTPDSFSDGGRYLTIDDALRRAEDLLEEGAVLIDVGGESSRPRGAVYDAGAEAVSADEERRRVLPVVAAIVARFPEALLSVDTYKPDIAREALAAGAHLINDITGLRPGPAMAMVAAAAGAPIIVMHARGHPGEMPHEHRYTDVVGEVAASLEQSVQVAAQAGVRHIITDPGFGFGKTPAENLQLINGVSTFLELGRPVMVGISRKSTIGTVLGRPGAPAPVAARLYGTLGATAVAVLRGASLVRTHDVRPTVEMLRVLAATTTEVVAQSTSRRPQS